MAGLSSTPPALCPSAVRWGSWRRHPPFDYMSLLHCDEAVHPRSLRMAATNLVRCRPLNRLRPLSGRVHRVRVWCEPRATGRNPRRQNSLSVSVSAFCFPFKSLCLTCRSVPGRQGGLSVLAGAKEPQKEAVTEKYGLEAGLFKVRNVIVGFATRFSLMALVLRSGDDRQIFR